MEDTYWNVSRSAMELVPLHGDSVISTQNSDHIIFLLQIFQNLLSYHVLQTWKDLALSDLPKFILRSSLPVIVTSFGFNCLLTVRTLQTLLLQDLLISLPRGFPQSSAWLPLTSLIHTYIQLLCLQVNYLWLIYTIDYSLCIIIKVRK